MSRAASWVANLTLSLFSKWAVIAYFQSRLWVDQDLVNFANSLMTLYPRLLETAKYQALFSPRPAEACSPS